MKKIFAWVLLLALCLTAGAEEIAPAQAVLEKFVSGEYAAISDMLAEEVRSAVGPEALESAWMQQVTQLGALKDVEFAEQQGFSIAILTHENGRQQLIVGLNADGKVETLLLQPVNGPAAVNERPLPEGVEKREAKLFAGMEMELGAEILIPSGACSIWAVLVHGSGPSDRDETVGGCKPFRDLAYNLAALGVGTIRFDKMTYVHPELRTATVEDEYLLSAQEALRVLKEETDAEKVVLIGHSQGGMLMPWLVTECGFDGGVALAGTPKPLWDISYQQNLAILEVLPEEQRGALQAQVDAERAKAESLEALPEDEMVFGLPVQYLKSMAALDQIALAKAANVPMLFAWGNADFQVSRADFEAWREGLGENEPFEYIEYEGLNHLFMEAQPGDDIANANAVYARGGEMASTVAADIAAWLAKAVSI